MLLSCTGVEVAHVASMLSEGVKVIVYGVLPVQVDSLTRALHTQDVNSIPHLITKATTTPHTL